MSGVVVIPDDAPAGTLHVRVERVDRADAAAEVLARTRIDVPGPSAAPRTAPFELWVPAPEASGRYTVRAHLATTARDSVESGDYVSTVAHAVLTRGHGAYARVTLRRTG